MVVRLKKTSHSNGEWDAFGPEKIICF